MTTPFRSRLWIQSVATSVTSAVVVCGTGFAAGPGAPIPPAPAFTSPDIKPTFADWITAHPIALAKKIRLTDPLLKPPFAAAPPDSLKGMAAGIRAVQLDVPNRVKAVQYLGTLDCVTYPQAQDMIIATMLEDPSEEVRYEAVMALRNMLTRGCCNTDTLCECSTCANRKQIVRETTAHAKKGQRFLIKEAKGPAKIAARKAHRDRETEEQRYDCCLGCANEKAMKALAKVASEKDDQCCWFEPSERIRAAAADGMCLFKSYSNGYSLPDGGPEPTPIPDDMKDGEVEPSNEMEVDPDAKPEAIEPAPVPKTEPSTSKPIEKKTTPQIATVRKQAEAAAMRKVEVRKVEVRKIAEPARTPAVVEEPVVTSAPVVPSAPSLSAVPVTPAVPALSAIPTVLPAMPTVSALPELKEQAEVLPEMPVIPGLRGRCIVALKSRRVLPVDQRYWSIFEERTYYFSSAEAKSAFDQSPKIYALAYGGLDPVSWLTSRQMEDGQVLREYNGQFFLFASKENWEIFKGNPNRFVLKTAETNLRTVSENQ